MKQEGKLIDGHFHLHLPLKKAEPMFPENRAMAFKRLKSMKNKMLKDENFRKDYTKFMSDMVSRGHAEKVDQKKTTPKGWKWFVPHHGVYHPVTKKFRIVMDCSASYQGVSLNEELMQGPDNNNLLLGVLLRFRSRCIDFH